MKSIACYNNNFLLFFSERLFFKQQVFYVFAFIARETHFYDPISCRTISMNQRYLNSCVRRLTVNGECNASPHSGTRRVLKINTFSIFSFLFVSNYTYTYIWIAPIYSGPSLLSDVRFVAVETAATGTTRGIRPKRLHRHSCHAVH